MSHLRDSERFAWYGTLCSAVAASVSICCANVFVLFFPDIREPETACEEGCLIVNICAWLSLITALLSVAVSVIMMLINKGVAWHFELSYNTKLSYEFKGRDPRSESDIIKACSGGCGAVWTGFSAWSLLLAELLYATRMIDINWRFPSAAHLFNFAAAIFCTTMMNAITCNYVRAISFVSPSQREQSARHLMQTTVDGDQVDPELLSILQRSEREAHRQTVYYSPDSSSTETGFIEIQTRADIEPIPS